VIKRDWLPGSNVFSRINKTGFLLWGVNHVPLKTGLLFPSFVDFQNSLFHPVCRFVGFTVLVHALAYMEQTWLFAILSPHTIFSFIDAEDNPAVQAFCENPAGFWH